MKPEFHIFHKWEDDRPTLVEKGYYDATVEQYCTVPHCEARQYRHYDPSFENYNMEPLPLPVRVVFWAIVWGVAIGLVLASIYGR